MHKRRNWLQRFIDSINNKLIGLLFLLFAIVMFGFLIEILEIFYGFSMMQWFKGLPYIYPITNHIFTEVEALTELGIFYIYSLGSFFIFPVPNEFFYLGLLRKFSYEYLLPIIYVGVFIGHNLNYFFGRMFGFLIKIFFTKKSIEKTKGYIDKYGAVVIFIFNATPLPSNVMNMCCGLFKYRYLKWLFASMPGQIVNYIILTIIYIKFLS